MRRALLMAGLLAGLLALPANAALAPGNPAVKPACEPFTDVRELRYRAPAATITGRIVPGSVAEPGAGRPELGQQLVLGTAELIEDGSGRRLAISYGYWATGEDCGGWEPARGAHFTFDLADDKSADTRLRVMRYGAPN